MASGKRIVLAARGLVYKLSTLWILIALVLFFSGIGRNFFRGGNISNIVNQASFLLIIGVAQLVVILTGGINLAIGSIMALTTVLMGPWLKADSGVFFLIPFVGVLAAGAAIGVLNGALVTKLSIPAFLATFATMYVARGYAWIHIGRGVHYGINETIRYLAMGSLFRVGTFRVTMPMLIAAIFLVVMWFVLERTNFGRKLYFTGSNQMAAKFSGVPTDRIIVAAHVLSGLISAFAGIMYVARINAADAALGAAYHFDAISVALIGGAIMAGGIGSVWGVACGALIISVIQAGMNNLKVPTELQATFLGVLIIAAVCFNAFLQEKRMLNTEEIIDEPGQGTGTAASAS